jgi:hypothetical protein
MRRTPLSAVRAGRVLSAVLLSVLTVAVAQPALAATSSGSPTSPVTPAAVTTQKAPQVGVITVVPATGNDQTAFALVTSKPCPSGTNVIGTILGPGLPDYGVNVVPNTTAALFPHTATGGLYMPSSNTMRNLINDLPDPQPLKGTYRLRVECRGPAKIADLGDFTGSIVWDGHHGFVAVEPDVPASSLQTVPPVTDPPIPSAAPSATKTASPTPAALKATSTAASKPSTAKGAAPWLVAVGAVLAAFGLLTFLRGRRQPGAKPKPKGATT